MAVASRPQWTSQGRSPCSGSMSTDFPCRPAPDRKDEMSSPAPHIRHGGPQQNGEVTGRASPGGSVRAAADDRLQKSRSMLVVIGALLLVVLVVGGSAGVLSITMGYVVPYTAAIVAVVASVAIVLVGMIG